MSGELNSISNTPPTASAQARQKKPVKIDEKWFDEVRDGENRKIADFMEKRGSKVYCFVCDQHLEMRNGSKTILSNHVNSRKHKNRSQIYFALQLQTERERTRDQEADLQNVNNSVNADATPVQSTSFSDAERSSSSVQSEYCLYYVMTYEILVQG